MWRTYFSVLFVKILNFVNVGKFICIFVLCYFLLEMLVRSNLLREVIYAKYRQGTLYLFFVELVPNSPYGCYL